MPKLNKTKYFLKLDRTTLQDPKIIKLTSNLGDEGFGVYIKLIILLSNNQGSFTNDPTIISRFIFSDENLIRNVINDYDLFKVENNEFYSNRLNIDLETMWNTSEKRKISGSKGGLKTQDQIRILRKEKE